MKSPSLLLAFLLFWTMSPTIVHAVRRQLQKQEENEQIELFKDPPETAAHLVKDHDPIPQATYHEGEPRVRESFGHDDDDKAARLVGQHRGPLTKKLVAVSTQGGMIETSMVAWKFANGAIEGTMEQRFLTTPENNSKNNDDGQHLQLLTKARVDCMLLVGPHAAVVGGNVLPATSSMTTTDHPQRAFLALLDARSTPELSNLELVPGDHQTCESWAREKGILLQDDNDKHQHQHPDPDHSKPLGRTHMLPADRVLVCNRRGGTEQDWKTCLGRQAKQSLHDMMIMEEVVGWME